MAQTTLNNTQFKAILARFNAMISAIGEGLREYCILVADLLKTNIKPC